MLFLLSMGRWPVETQNFASPIDGCYLYAALETQNFASLQIGTRVSMFSVILLVSGFWGL